jgi:voltage-gated potassium channel Kch
MKHIGVIGMGRVGLTLALTLANSGFKIYYFTPNVLRTYFTEIGFEILDPYDYPTFYTEHPTSLCQLLRNSAKWTLLHSRFLRRRALQPYLKAHCADLLPMARKPIT